MEVRKDIKNYEGLYQISNFGKVKSLRKERFNGIKKYYQKEKILKLIENHNGYYFVNLYKNKKGRGFLVHRIVAQNFLGIDIKYNKKNLVCHKDDNPKNNHIDNLFIGTHKDNIQDAIKKGRMSIGEKNGYAKLNKKQVIEIKKLLNTNLLQKDIAKMFGVSRRTIGAIKTGDNWKHIF